MGNTFGFLFHPILIREHVNKKYPPLGTVLPISVINFLCQFFPPQYISEITGITSSYTEEEVRGWFVATPFTTQVLHDMPIDKAYGKIADAINKLEGLGAQIVGLGAHVAVIGDAGISITERVSVPVTTGNSYTVAVAVKAVEEAARIMDINISEATVAIVGATGSIGKACARIFAQRSGKLILVGRREDAIRTVGDLCEGQHARVVTTTDINQIYEADLLITVSSAIDAIIQPQHLKPGAVVLDVARPRDVSPAVAKMRDDVLVIEGGMVEVPGENATFNFDFGFPEKKAFACMVETIALAMEGRYESFSLGKEIAPHAVDEMYEICTRHGFKLAGFRAFEHAVSQQTIDTVRENAFKNRKHWSPALGT